MLVSLFAICALLADFNADLRKAGKSYQALDETTEPALVRADLKDAQRMFLDVVPEAERTAAHYFVLGNKWFELDPAFAQSMFERAASLAPDEASIRHELALSLQRLGRYAEAEASYAALPAESRALPPVDLLRADCFARTGHFADAAAAWSRARASGADSEHLDHVLDWIYGPENPIARRARWVAELRAGDASHVEELVLGDVFWRPEDERYFVKYEYLEHDMTLAREKLDMASERAKDLFAIADFLFLDWELHFPRDEDPSSLRKLRESARERHWSGDGARLPENSLVARHVIEALLESGADAAELFKQHRDDLLRRARGATGDSEALRALVTLAERAGSPDVEPLRALAKPSAVDEARKAAQTARAENRPHADLLVAQIKAEFEAVPRDFAALDAAFADLATQSDMPPTVQRGSK